MVFDEHKIRITSTATEVLFGAQTQFITDFDRNLALIFTAVMALSAGLLFFLPAPYGKFNKSMDFLPILSTKINWKWSFFLSESPAIIIPIIVTFHYRQYVDPLYWLWFAIYEIHYIHRLIVYPFFRVRSKTPSTLIIALMSFFFQSLNGYLMSKFSLFIDFDPITEIRIAGMFMGLVLCGSGAFLNIYCDQILITLRKQDEDGVYRLPRGFLFEMIASPNYLCEIVEWLGLALAYPSLASWCFVANCCFNLVPRAYTTHKYYQLKFGSKYPRSRKCIIPFIF